MKTLKLIGHGLLVLMWLFNTTFMRLVVAAEALMFLVVMPFNDHIGLSTGPNTTLVYSERLMFLLGLPLFNVVLSLLVSHTTLFGNKKLFFAISTALNIVLCMGMARFWPLSVHAELLFALYTGAIMSLASLFSYIALRNSLLGQVPRLEKKQPS